MCIKWDSRSLRRCSFNALTCCFFCKSICTLEQRNFCRKGKSCSARFTSRWNFEKWNSKNSHRTSFFQDLWIKVIFSRTFKTCFVLEFLVCRNMCIILRKGQSGTFWGFSPKNSMKTFQTVEWETGSVVIKLGQLKLNSKSLRMCSELFSVHYPTNTLRTNFALNVADFCK